MQKFPRYHRGHNLRDTLVSGNEYGTVKEQTRFEKTKSAYEVMRMLGP